MCFAPWLRLSPSRHLLSQPTPDSGSTMSPAFSSSIPPLCKSHRTCCQGRLEVPRTMYLAARSRHRSHRGPSTPAR